jgi:hypothetical protein
MPHIRGRGRETVYLHLWNCRRADGCADCHARPCLAQSARGDGGASRDRTDDLKLAKLALSQLSYGPIGSCLLASMVGRVGVEPTTSRLSGVRSNHLSYRPHTIASRPKGRGRREPAQAALPGHQFLGVGSVPG